MKGISESRFVCKKKFIHTNFFIYTLSELITIKSVTAPMGLKVIFETQTVSSQTVSLKYIRKHP